MSRLATALAYALAIALIGLGITKFSGAHIFQYIAAKSGIDLFYPVVNALVGAAEIVTGGLLVWRTTRPLGALSALGVVGGAIGFHLSPWLGVVTPVGFAPDAAAPWGLEDFSAETSPVLFIIALALFGLAAASVYFERERVARLAQARSLRALST